MPDFDFRKYSGGPVTADEQMEIAAKLMASADAVPPDVAAAANAAADFYTKSLIATCVANGFGLAGITGLILRRLGILYEIEGQKETFVQSIRFNADMIERGEL